jgi:hypothetical protein
MVTNTDGHAGTLLAGLTYVATVQVTSVAPPAPPPGTMVTVTGNGFSSGLTMLVAGVPVAPAFVLPTVLSFQMPAGVPCDSLLTLVTPSGQVVSIPFNAAPVISLGIGMTGPASGGGTFFLLGSEFHPGTTVTVGGTPAPVLALTATSIAAQAPPGPPGPTMVWVSSLSGCTATTTYTYQ